MFKAMEGIGIIKKLSKTIIRHSLIAIHKSLADLSYGTINYVQPNNESLDQKTNEFNIMLLLQLQVPLKKHLRVNYTSNWVFNFLDLDVALGNYILSTPKQNRGWKSSGCKRN